MCTIQLYNYQYNYTVQLSAFTVISLVNSIQLDELSLPCGRNVIMSVQHMRVPYRAHGPWDMPFLITELISITCITRRSSLHGSSLDFATLLDRSIRHGRSLPLLCEHTNACCFSFQAIYVVRFYRFIFLQKTSYTRIRVRGWSNNCTPVLLVAASQPTRDVFFLGASCTQIR